MKRAIMLMGSWLAILAASAQFSDRNRLVSINPLRNGDGSFMKANNPLFLNSSSSDATIKKIPAATPVTNDLHAFRINSIQALCDINSLQLNWTALQQQADGDHFDIEQSADGGITWTSIGIVPAARSAIGETPYQFSYNESPGNVDLRVTAVNLAGEKRYSSIVHSACSNTNLLSVSSLVYSTANVRIGSPKSQNVKMVLVNQSGLPVQVREEGLAQGVNSFSLDMSALSPGFYVLTISWPGGRQESVKIMKR
jgi:hypothetical protein